MNIRWVAIEVKKNGEKTLFLQRVRVWAEGKELGPRAIELMATPVVKEHYPKGKIIGWYDNYEQRYNSGDIEVGYTIGELKNTCQGMSI